MRWDLDGDGVPTGTSTQITAYNAAFPDAEDNMGCNEEVASITAGTGNPVCSGYELRADLDFNTGMKDRRTDDTYYNSGAGWPPIGDGTTAYTGDFDGNNDTDSTGDGGPYTITNLFIKRLVHLRNILRRAVRRHRIGREDWQRRADGRVRNRKHDRRRRVRRRPRGQERRYDNRILVARRRNRQPNGCGNGQEGIRRRSRRLERRNHPRRLLPRGGHGFGARQQRRLRRRAGRLERHGRRHIPPSYAAGDLTSNRGSQTGNAVNNDAFTGGLVAVNKGSITASYATGDLTADGKNTDMGRACRRQLRNHNRQLRARQADRHHRHERNGDNRRLLRHQLRNHNRQLLGRRHLRHRRRRRHQLAGGQNHQRTPVAHHRNRHLRQLGRKRRRQDRQR